MAWRAKPSKKRVFLAFLILAFLTSPFAAAETPSPTLPKPPPSSQPVPKLPTLRIVLHSIRSDRGKIFLTLFNSEKGYPTRPDHAFLSRIAPIHQGRSTVTFSIPFGNYAVAAFHDENDNGKLDTNFLGIPREGMGASNDAKGFMGPPPFRKAVFPFQKDGAEILIKISY